MSCPFIKTGPKTFSLLSQESNNKAYSAQHPGRKTSHEIMKFQTCIIYGCGVEMYNYVEISKVNF